MQTDYSRDLVDPDQALHDAADERPGKPIRLRIHPTILRKAPHGGQYQPWKGVSWMLDCESPEEAIAFREALRLFFTTLNQQGHDVTVDRLRTPTRREVDVA